eukprot:3124114-Pleurochrysis_carterae.AAC.2
MLHAPSNADSDSDAGITTGQRHSQKSGLVTERVNWATLNVTRCRVYGRAIGLSMAEFYVGLSLQSLMQSFNGFTMTFDMVMDKAISPCIRISYRTHEYALGIL